MNPRERAIRLADLQARQRRAAAAAEGLHSEYLMASIINIILDAPGGPAEFRRIVAANPGAPRPWHDAVIALDAREREEAAIELRLAEEEVSRLRGKERLDLTYARAAAKR